MTTFTASEVRATAHKWPNWRVGEMLHAYADRLEADEKGVPVGYVNADALKDLESGEVLNIHLWASSDDFVSPIVEIYTHPAPTERLFTQAEVKNMLIEAHRIARDATLRPFIAAAEDFAPEDCALPVAERVIATQRSNNHEH